MGAPVLSTALRVAQRRALGAPHGCGDAGTNADADAGTERGIECDADAPAFCYA